MECLSLCVYVFFSFSFSSSILKFANAECVLMCAVALVSCRL